MNLNDFLRDVPDFPKPGIIFKDITPLLADPKALGTAIDRMADFVDTIKIDRLCAIESRGFLFGTPLALKLDARLTPIRKPGKLPWKTYSAEYDLEYGKDMLEIHADGIHSGEQVLMVDDVLATGGTMQAACRLVEQLGGNVVACVFLLELTALEGRSKLQGRTVHALLT
ncbi:MAG: adenine phosphoribosyltransferase [Planctomycetota bacterium]|jgi:adenine phosphoribosyltransferase